MLSANPADRGGLRRKSAYDAYKLRAADRSQACFGLPEAAPSTTTVGVDGAVADFLHKFAASYRPARAQRSGGGRDPQASPPDQAREPRGDNASDGPRRRASSTASTLSADSLASSAPAAAPATQRYQRRHSAPAEPPKSVLRRKFRPRHRSSELNESVAGIMRPSRYSSSEGHLPGLQSSYTRRASWSSSAPSVALSDVSSHSNESWVPLGVEFSACMEVYLFDKNH